MPQGKGFDMQARVLESIRLLLESQTNPKATEQERSLCSSSDTVECKQLGGSPGCELLHGKDFYLRVSDAFRNALPGSTSNLCNTGSSFILQTGLPALPALPRSSILQTGLSALPAPPRSSTLVEQLSRAREGPGKAWSH